MKIGNKKDPIEVLSVRQPCSSYLWLVNKNFDCWWCIHNKSLFLRIPLFPLSTLSLHIINVTNRRLFIDVFPRKTSRNGTSEKKIFLFMKKLFMFIHSIVDSISVHAICFHRRQKGEQKSDSSTCLLQNNFLFFIFSDSLSYLINHWMVAK